MIAARILEWMERHSRRLGWIMLAIMAGIVVIDVLVPTGYGRFPWDGIGGLGAIFGLTACVLIVVVSKALGYRFLYRPETYYDEPPQPESSGETDRERRDDA